MKRILILIAALSMAACAMSHVAPITSPSIGPKVETSDGIALGVEPTTVSVMQPTDSAANDPEVGFLTRIQDRLNFLASPKYLDDVAAAKAGGADAYQVACMDVSVDIGADLKAQPLISLPHLDLSGVDQNCGWCLLAAKRKLAADLRGGPSLLTRVAEGKKRINNLVRRGAIGCAQLEKDMKLQLATPENAVADFLTLLKVLGGGQ